MIVTTIASIRRQNASTQSNVLSPLPLSLMTSGDATWNTCAAVHDTICRVGQRSSSSVRLIVPGSRRSDHSIWVIRMYGVKYATKKRNAMRVPSLQRGAGIGDEIPVSVSGAGSTTDAGTDMVGSNGRATRTVRTISDGPLA